MLVLTRKQNEKIQIGENITITVLRMKGKAVRLGIEAPSDVNVLRGELVFELPEEAPTEQTAAKAPSLEKPSSARQPSEPNPRRHGLEVGQVATDRWPVEKHNEPSAANPLRGLSAAPLAEIVNARTR